MCFFLYQHPVHIHQLPLTCHMTCPPRLCYPNNIRSAVKAINLLINLLDFPVTSISLDPNTSLCTLLSNTLNRCLSCNSRDDVSRQDKELYKPQFKTLHNIDRVLWTAEQTIMQFAQPRRWSKLILGQLPVWKYDGNWAVQQGKPIV